ncbi:AMP-binding protein [Micromonospora okii]|uniref:Nonribosomal peptide synthetase n=1 Tax=Micromonospora okii TaxID=1182970 RepID=A0A023GUH6_9ACTN|nr:AMP-binding protein [Micromonospora okii]AFJ52660.1 nonribosomal peptide synthetase [Micromonospora okii]
MTARSELVTSILRTATTDPDSVALVWRDQEIGYGALVELAARARDRVTALDLDDDEPVGVLADKSPEAVALVLGVLQAGRPFLLPASNLPSATLRELFGQAGCRHVLSPRDTLRLPGVVAGRVPEGTSFMLTTSGSTGLPKVVPLGADAIDRFVAWASGRFGIGPGVRVLNYAPLNFDLCLLDVWTTLGRGGTVVLVDPDQALQAGALAALVARERVSVVQAVPMLFGLLAGPEADAGRTGDAGSRADARLGGDAGSGGGRGQEPAPRVFPDVAHLVFTGDAMPNRLLRRLPAAFPSARLYNLYGCTETNDSFLCEVDRDGPFEGPVPLGEPLPGVDAAVVAPDGAIVDGAGSGELWVRTPFQSVGYLGAAAGSGRFGPDPSGRPGPAWYRSGDLVRRDADGRLFLIGRDDHRVKVRGVGVDLGEVEQALLGHPEAADAVVLAVPDALVGSRLHAVVRRAAGSTLNSLTLRQHCAGVLPRGAIPETVRVVDAPFPRTSTGKVDRLAVRQAHLTSSFPEGV